MSQRNTSPAMHHDMHHELLNHLGRWSVSGLGAIITFLAQFTPKEVEGWMQLGGIAIALGGAGWAIKYLIGKNDQKDVAILGLVERIENVSKEQQAKLDEERRRLELKWDAERRENLDHRDKDRETRTKLADVIEKLSDSITSK